MTDLVLEAIRKKARQENISLHEAIQLSILSLQYKILKELNSIKKELEFEVL